MLPPPPPSCLVGYRGSAPLTPPASLWCYSPLMGTPGGDPKTPPLPSAGLGLGEVMLAPWGAGRGRLGPTPPGWGGANWGAQGHGAPGPCPQPGVTSQPHSPWGAAKIGLTVVPPWPPLRPHCAPQFPPVAPNCQRAAPGAERLLGACGVAFPVRGSPSAGQEGDRVLGTPGRVSGRRSALQLGHPAVSCGAGAAQLRAPGPRGELGSLLGRGRGCGDGAVPAEGWPGHDSAFCWRSEALAGLSPSHPPPQGTRLGNSPGTGLGRTGPQRHWAPAGWSQPRAMAPAPGTNPPCCPWAGSGPAEGPQPRCQRWPSPAAQHPAVGMSRAGLSPG